MTEYTDVAQQLDKHLKRCMLRLMPKKQRRHDSDRDDFDDDVSRSGGRKAATLDGGRHRRTASSRARSAIKYTDMVTISMSSKAEQTTCIDRAVNSAVHMHVHVACLSIYLSYTLVPTTQQQPDNLRHNADVPTRHAAS